MKFAVQLEEAEGVNFLISIYINMIKKYFLFPIVFISLIFQLSAKDRKWVQRVEPGNWWTEMNQPEFQLMLQGVELQSAVISIHQKGITIVRKEITDNPNFVFLYLNVAKETLPGKFIIELKKGKKIQTVVYELKKRTFESSARKSFTEADAIYLLMPDRFANGNQENDSIRGYFQGVHR